MTEQPRTISRRRITGSACAVDEATLATIRRWLDDFLYPTPISQRPISPPKKRHVEKLERCLIAHPQRNIQQL